MLVLRIERPAGHVEERPLARAAPLSIGRHASNDVRIDDEGVATLHCRIAWNRDTFEIVAASPQGVDVNGTLVQSALLRPGDVIRIGNVDLRLMDGDAAPAAGVKLDEDPGLKPLDDEDRPRAAAPGRAPASPAAVAAPPAPARETQPKRREPPSPPKPERKLSPRKPASAQANAEEIVVAEILEEEDDLDMLPGHRSEKSRRKKPRGFWGRIGAFLVACYGLLKRFIALFRHQEVRPGQEDVVRSPFSLGMVISGAILTLAAATLLFVIGRDSADIAFTAAQEDFDEGRYTQAQEQFRRFIEQYPRDERRSLARILAGRAAIEREMGGAAPNPARGLVALKAFIDENRDDPDFPNLADDIRRYSERIAFESAKQAERSRSRKLIPALDEAKAILKRYPPPEGPQTELVARIDAARLAAIDAIEKREWTDEKLAAIESLLEANDPPAAFATRRELLARYPDMERDERVVKLLERTRETERAKVVRDDTPRDALTEEQPERRFPFLALAAQTRTRTDLDSEGRRAIALAGGACFGVDTVTGEPIWRRPIGLDPPFYPVAVPSTPPAWLVFDRRHNELLLIEQESGALRWRQPVGGPVSGAPLIHEGSIYLPTLGNQLHKIDLASGRAVARLTFSQKIHSPPVLADDGKRLLIAGDQDVFYTVTLNPLECVAVSYLAHPPASIEAPLLRMGPLLLFAENDQRAGARLRVLDTKGTLLRQIDEARLPGQVRDAPIIRGRELFVPYGDEAIAAFTVTDDENERPLTQVGSRQLQNPRPGPMFLTAGADGQLWLASTALRKLQLTTSELRLEPGEVSAGRYTQPMQVGRDSFFIARRPPYSETMFFSQVDRDTLVGRWRAVLGGRIIGWNTGDGTAVCVTESGHAYAIPRGVLGRDRFVTRAVELNLPDGLARPLRATPLPDGRVAVYVDGAQPRLWLVSRAGQPESRPFDIPAALDTAIAPLGDGLVIPLPGQLRYLSVTGGTAVQEFALPVGRDRPPRWKYILPIAGDAALAVDEAGLARRIELQSAPVPALVETHTFSTSSPIDVPPHAHGGRIALADAGRMLHLLDAATLEQIAETPLNGPATGGPWLTADGKVIVEVGRSRLVCFDANPQLQLLWTVPITETHLAGPPAQEGDTLIAALQNGGVLAIEAASGTVSRQIDLAQPLTDGPRRIGEHIVVPALDGALIRIESILGGMP